MNFFRSLQAQIHHKAVEPELAFRLFGSHFVWWYVTSYRYILRNNDSNTERAIHKLWEWFKANEKFDREALVGWRADAVRDFNRAIGLDPDVLASAKAYLVGSKRTCPEDLPIDPPRPLPPGQATRTNTSDT
jgi:hypothetical protein